MITAIEARVLANRKTMLNEVIHTYDKEIRTVASNGQTELKVYHDAIIRKHKLSYMSKQQTEEFFRSISVQLQNLGYNVNGFDNKLVIDWATEQKGQAV